MNLLKESRSADAAATISFLSASYPALAGMLDRPDGVAPATRTKKSALPPIAKRPASGFDAKANEDLVVVGSKPPPSRDSANATLTGSLVPHKSGPVPKKKQVLPFDDTDDIALPELIKSPTRQASAPLEVTPLEPTSPAAKAA